MNRVIQVIERETERTKITRIFETDVDPPEDCIECGGPTLWNAEGESRQCVDCGDVQKAITTPRLAIAGGGGDKHGFISNRRS